uniref:Bublin coiled coil protein n=1 Tax=Hucho hucho TaxID=62062 RepID=A0A4W5K0M9_9TELE
MEVVVAAAERYLGVLDLTSEELQGVLSGDVPSFQDDEYVAINTMLDQINPCLDDLKERNDSLNDKLHELLESNRQAWQEFRVQLSTATPPRGATVPGQGFSGSEGEKGEEDKAGLPNVIQINNILPIYMSIFPFLKCSCGVLTLKSEWDFSFSVPFM